MNAPWAGALAWMAAFGIAAMAAADPAPLSLDQALAGAARWPAERRIAQTRGLAYCAPSLTPRPVPSPVAAARIETMARFFDVILADFDESALSARMSTAFVAWERLRQRKPDDTGTLRGHHAYLDLLSRLNAARDNQRRARSSLAIALGVPGKLPGELLDPVLPDAAMPEAGPGGGREANAGHEFVSTKLELEWLMRHERARAKARNALAERALDEARALLDAGEPADLGDASAAGIEALRDARQVEFAIAIARERLAALSVGTPRR